jgi:hypothetical protein
MKSYTTAIALVAALTVGTLGPVQARDKAARHGAHKQSHAAMQHRATPRNARPRVHRPSVNQHVRAMQKRSHQRAAKRIWRTKGRHHAVKRGYWKHQRIHRRFHQPRHYRRHGHGAYPVYVDAPGRSLGFEIETEAFRFQVNKSD